MALRTRPTQFPKLGSNVQTEQITAASRLVSYLTGFAIQPNKAVVGGNAFAHESGIHQDGVIKNPLTYEIMTPQSVGLSGSSITICKLSGRRGLANKLAELATSSRGEALDSIYHQAMRSPTRRRRSPTKTSSPSSSSEGEVPRPSGSRAGTSPRPTAARRPGWSRSPSAATNTRRRRSATARSTPCSRRSTPRSRRSRPGTRCSRPTRSKRFRRRGRPGSRARPLPALERLGAGRIGLSGHGLTRTSSRPRSRAYLVRSQALRCHRAASSAYVGARTTELPVS